MNEIKNLTAPTVPIDLDRRRYLKVDFNALAAMERATGRNTLEASGWKNLDAGAIRAFLWASLVHEDPSLTIEQCGSWIHSKNLPEILHKLHEARKLSTNGGEGNGGDPLAKGQG